VGRRALLLSIPAAVGGFALGRLTSDQRAAELPDGIADIGALYHRWSKAGHSIALGAEPDWGGQPPRHKVYTDAERVGLPDPRGWDGNSNGTSLEAAIQARRSRRTYSAEPLSLEELSRLLHSAGGITDQTRGFRAAPSAGALYPIETYPVVHDVSGLERGIYHYVPQDHALERLRAMDARAAMVVAGVGQEMMGLAQTCLVLSAIFQRTRWRYRERTYRYVLMEAGHIAQNVYLAATSLGLGACAVGAFLDDALNGLLGLDGDQEAALYVITVGRT
jgi:SagB-type dehydrogenase family enzyme